MAAESAGQLSLDFVFVGVFCQTLRTHDFFDSVGGDVNGTLDGGQLDRLFDHTHTVEVLAQIKQLDIRIDVF